MQLDNNNVITNSEDIRNAQVEYFKNLFTSKYKKPENHDDLFTNVAKLDDNDKEKCEGVITASECEQILKTFPSNKSPGNDGISSEFYRFFWNEIKIPLINSFNYSYHFGELSASQKQSVITLIHKKDKDRLNLDNWRPISLLNVDYKIITK